MALLEIKFSILLILSFMMFSNLHPSLYLNLPIVRIENGEILGENNGNYFAFRGLPYAETGRFELPRRFTRHWHQILSFNEFGSECAQYDHMSYSFKGREDCLSLNVFVPKKVLKSEESVPVIFFIYGGAFMYGGSEFYGPEMIMKEQSLIVVTINYRLGILGFLSTEDEVLPGNLGMKDQVEALKWVQRNIKNFNGDSSKVTIVGFSAGGASVQLHNLSPLSNGLFNNGISHSGVALNPWVMMENGKDKAFKVGELVGCDSNINQKPDSKKLLKCLKRVPVKTLVMAAKHFQPFLYNPFSPFGVVVEKHNNHPFLHEHPEKILESMKYQKRPFISSITQDDGLYPAIEFYNDEILRNIDENWNDLAPHILDYNCTTNNNELKLEWSKQIRKFYFNDEKIAKENFDKLSKLMTDRIFKNGFYDALKLQSSHSDTFCYHFRYETKKSIDILNTEIKNISLGVAHGDDLFLIFNNRKLNEYTSDDKIIGRNLIQMYESFAYSNEVKYADEQIKAIKGDSLECLEIITPDNYSMKTLERSSAEKEFWKSLKIPE